METAALVNSGRRVVALGTTAARALEHSALSHGRVTAGDAEADIFIYPGYRFRIIDALLTNFHAQSEGVTSDQIVDKLLELVPVPRSGM